MKKMIGGLVLCIIITTAAGMCSNYGNSNNSNSNNRYTEGYNKGYEEGYNTAEKEYQNSGYESGYNKAKQEYQLRINKLVAEYEEKTKESYNNGFTEGEISMRDRITEEIELNAKNKAR
jgi:flagellar biosynthesis/type III secretory pathway protein FliH